MKTSNRPIWGFPAELSYLALFSLLVVLGAAFRIWYETDRRVDRRRLGYRRRDYRGHRTNRFSGGDVYGRHSGDIGGHYDTCGTI